MDDGHIYIDVFRDNPGILVGKPEGEKRKVVIDAGTIIKFIPDQVNFLDLSIKQENI